MVHQSAAHAPISVSARPGIEPGRGGITPGHRDHESARHQQLPCRRSRRNNASQIARSTAIACERRENAACLILGAIPKIDVKIFRRMWYLRIRCLSEGGGATQTV